MLCGNRTRPGAFRGILRLATVSNRIGEEVPWANRDLDGLVSSLRYFRSTVPALADR